jgi:hypothetical protein
MLCRPLSRRQCLWLCGVAGIIALGMLSRVVHTGFLVFDKYPGDALYAAMVYSILRVWSRSAAVPIAAMLIMLALELFQLTMIPSRLLASEHLILRVCARLLGTQFSFSDLLAYVVGIGCIYAAERFVQIPAYQE